MYRLLKGLFLFYLVINATEIVAQNANAYEKAGDKSYDKGDFFNATYYYSRANDLDENNTSLVYKLANAYFYSKDYRRASSFFSRVVVDDKAGNFPLAVYHLGETKKNMGLYESAKSFFKQYADKYGSTDDFYSRKAKDELLFCDSAILFMDNPIHVRIENAGDNVNSEFSDFAAQQIQDSIIYFTSMRFPIQDQNNETKYVSRIMQSEIKNNHFREAEELKGDINSQDIYNSSSSISGDNKLMVFCHCFGNDSNTVLQCQLYESLFQNKIWSTPKKLDANINSYGSTSTQPCIATNGAQGYVLYFVSDRQGGKGKLDIWRSYRSANGIYSAPQNLSEAVNTYDDDVSPYFNPLENALYFASKGKASLGGFDIHRAAQNGNDFVSTMNIGYPLNSSYDDFYFTLNQNDTSGLLTSNRPGSMFMKNETCCYDIYYFKFSKDDRNNWLKKKEPTLIVVKKDSIAYQTQIAELDFEFPLKLYFDNDQPDPHTTKTTTDERYDALYNDFVLKQKEFESGYSSAFKKQEKESATEDVVDFFENYVQKNYSNVDTMCAFLLRKLSAGKTIKLKIRGAASPLAASFYNYNLSERRIVSVLNYFDFYNNGALKKYLYETKTFVIEKEPLGETDTPAGLTDKLTNKAFSVYSPDASRQRYIEILSLSIGE